MVRPDEEFRRIGKRLVTGVPARVGMAMGGQDGKAADAVIEPPRQRARLVIGREQPILVQQRRGLGVHFVSTLSRRKLYRSEEHTSELQSLMRISYAAFCLKTK